MPSIDGWARMTGYNTIFIDDRDPFAHGFSGLVRHPMKITAIRAYQVDLPLKEGRYTWSNGNFVEVFDATVVAVETDAGITGYGECCPLGSAYLPAYAAGVRAGLQEIAPKLIGLDPPDLGVLNRRMDAVLRGHPYVKAPIDVACWDILGKVAGLPVYTLLGGAEQDDVELYRAISQDDARRDGAQRRRLPRRGLHASSSSRSAATPNDDIERIRACRAMLEPGDVLVADANTGWTMHEAARVVARGARCRRLHRAALPDLRGMPDRPPPHRPAVHARRGHRRHRRPGARASPTARWT